MIAQHVWYIAERDEEGDALLPRQRRMYNFCLVSRQWYSAGISYLYACPELRTGETLEKFTRTVTQPVCNSARSDVEFGLMVYILKLGHFVDRDYDSLTAPLLSSAKQNLISFVAPQSSLGVDSMMALSKCRSLEQLDLSRTLDISIEFPHLKEAISNLRHLKSLTLSMNTKLSHTDISTGDWPNSLRSIKIEGTLDADVMSTFQWPSHPFKLTLHRCTNLNTSMLESVLYNEQLRRSLTRLYIDFSNDRMFEDAPSGILYSLPNLVHLRVPIDFTEHLLMLPPIHGVPPLRLRVLELTVPYFNELLENLAEHLLLALEYSLTNVIALGVSRKCLRILKTKEKAINDKIWKHIEKPYKAELVEMENLGLYTVDD